MKDALDNLRAIDGVDVAGKRVLVRADLNVPVSGGAVTDATRIQRVLPTIRALSERGAKVVMVSHFGRPKGKPHPDMSLKIVTDSMRGMLPGVDVQFVEGCVGAHAQAVAGALEDGQVAVLENLRFHPGEEANSTDFAKSLGALADIYVNDAFSTAHRAHASTEAITRLLPSYAGPALMAEIIALRTALDNPERPVAAVVGGAKISTKIPVLTNLLPKVDFLIIGGAMANTFLFAMGHGVGKSLCEPDFAETATGILAAAREQSCEILLPKDVVVAEEFSEGAPSEVCGIDAVGQSGMILDVGPATVADLAERLSNCRTLLWNGPLGAFEIEPFGAGTFKLAQEAAALTKQGTLTSVAGGGDTVAALNAAGVMQDFTYISTAGGAFLEWLEGRELPGVAALARNQQHQLARSA